MTREVLLLHHLLEQAYISTDVFLSGNVLSVLKTLHMWARVRHQRWVRVIALWHTGLSRWDFPFGGPFLTLSISNLTRLFTGSKQTFLLLDTADWNVSRGVFLHLITHQIFLKEWMEVRMAGQIDGRIFFSCISLIATMIQWRNTVLCSKMDCLSHNQKFLLLLDTIIAHT